MAPPRIATFCALSLVAAQAWADVRLFEHDGFRGRSIVAERPVADLARFGFNDLASSVVVRGRPWVVCEHSGFAGRCVTLAPGRYPSLSAIGLNDRISSLRPLRPGPPRPPPPYPPPPPPYPYPR